MARRSVGAVLTRVRTWAAGLVARAVVDDTELRAAVEDQQVQLEAELAALRRRLDRLGTRVRPPQIPPIPGVPPIVPRDRSE